LVHDSGFVNDCARDRIVGRCAQDFDFLRGRAHHCGVNRNHFVNPCLWAFSNETSIWGFAICAENGIVRSEASVVCRKEVLVTW
jgi:hypothetical protein